MVVDIIMGALSKEELKQAKETFSRYNEDEIYSALDVTLARLGLDCIDTINALKEKIWILEHKDQYPVE